MISARVVKNRLKYIKIIISSLLTRDKANSQKRVLVIATKIYLKVACNNYPFSFAELVSGLIMGNSLNSLLFKNDHLHLTNFGYEKLSLLFVGQLKSVLGKTHETLQKPQYVYSHKSAISFTLNKEDFPPLLSAYIPLDIHKSVINRKLTPRIEIVVKFNIRGPTHNISNLINIIINNINIS